MAFDVMSFYENEKKKEKCLAEMKGNMKYETFA